jgi:hypothetical protein
MAEYSRRELAADLEALLALPVRSQADLDAWYTRAYEVNARLRASDGTWSVSEEVWHFLFDADTRLKCPEYGETQVRTVRDIIEDLKRPDS